MSILLVLACAVGVSQAQQSGTDEQVESVMSSGMLEATPGYTGSKLGVEVEDVEMVDGNLQEIELNIPFSMHRVDRIQIEAANGAVIELLREPEIEAGSDPFNTDVRIYMPRTKSKQFRIRIIDLPEDRY